MKKLTKVFSNLKDVNDELFLKNEKITIINQNKIIIQNYQEIKEISDSLISLSAIAIIGKNLKLETISKYFIEISGKIHKINFGVDNYD